MPLHFLQGLFLANPQDPKDKDVFEIYAQFPRDADCNSQQRRIPGASVAC
jgi:hypothetical protein